jgi:hypothetical protein
MLQAALESPEGSCEFGVPFARGSSAPEELIERLHPDRTPRVVKTDHQNGFSYVVMGAGLVGATKLQGLSINENAEKAEELYV